MLKTKNLNKKAADKMLSMYWFVIVVIVAFGLFAMVYMFYSYPYDVREVESDILSSKIADCISREGRINPVFLSENNISVLEICSLNFDSEEDFADSGEQYFLEIEVFSIKNDASNVFAAGNLNFKEDCYIEDKKGEEYKRLVKCSEKRVYAVDEESNQYLIKILSGVAKSEKNVKL